MFGATEQTPQLEDAAPGITRPAVLPGRSMSRLISGRTGWSSEIALRLGGLKTTSSEAQFYAFRPFSIPDAVGFSASDPSAGSLDLSSREA